MKTWEQICKEQHAVPDSVIREAIESENLDEPDAFNGWQTGKIITNEAMCQEDIDEYSKR